MTLEPHRPGRLLTETGGAVLGGLLGVVAGGPLSLAAGPAFGSAAGGIVGAAAAPVFERWIGRMLPEFRRRGQIMADAAAHTSGMDAEAVLERVLERDEAQPLVARVLEAAARTNADEVLRLLGGVLGEAAAERPTRVDEDLMLVAGITDLTPGHLRVLEVLENEPKRQNAVWDPELVAADIGEALSGAGLVAALGALTARGLIENSPGFYGGPGYRITDFGRALLAAARRARSAGSDDGRD